MKIVRKYSCLVLLIPPLVLAGCAPKNESALIYSSAMSGGLNLQTPNMTDGQVKITLGYATNDFAYVPVAAGYGCDISDDKADPDKDQHKGSGKCKGLERLHGDKTDVKSDEVGKKLQEVAVREALLLAESLHEAEKKYGSAKANEDRAREAFSEISVEAGKFQSNTDYITKNYPAYNEIIKELNKNFGFSNNCQEIIMPPEENTDTTKQNKILEFAYSLINQPKFGLDKNERDKEKYNLVYVCAKNNLDSSTDAASKLKFDVQKAEEAQKAGQNYAKNIAATTDSNSKRTDAYSVFGTFEHNGTASSARDEKPRDTEGKDQGGGASPTGGGNKNGAAASLTAGKIFATGIAAQNLTEGIQAHLQHACVEQVRSAALLISEGPIRSDFVSSLVTQCLSKSPQEVKPPPAGQTEKK